MLSAVFDRNNPCLYKGKGKRTRQTCLHSWAEKVHGLGQQTTHRAHQHAGQQASCLLSDSMVGDASGGSYRVWVSDPTRHWGLTCNAKLAFPGKSTQEPQRGGRSSYEADSRLTANSLLLFRVFLWLFVSERLSEPSRISACKLCYTKAAGSTPYITVFQSTLNSSLSKDKSTVLYMFPCLLSHSFLFSPLSFSFYLSSSFFTHCIFPPFCNFTSIAVSNSSSLPVLLQE